MLGPGHTSGLKPFPPDETRPTFVNRRTGENEDERFLSSLKMMIKTSHRSQPSTSEGAVTVPLTAFLRKPKRNSHISVCHRRVYNGPRRIFSNSIARRRKNSLSALSVLTCRSSPRLSLTVIQSLKQQALSYWE